MKRFVLTAFCLFLLNSAIVLNPVLNPASANEDVIKSKQADFVIEKIASGLDHPWALAFLPDGRMLVTERSGSLRVIENGQMSRVTGLPPIAAAGQGGLLDVIADPAFEKNSLIYFSYSARGQGGVGTQVARAKLVGNSLQDVQVLFTATPKSGNYLHFGSRLVIDQHNHLYITIGEKFNMRQAQNPANHLGTVVRINTDGTIPENNPFLKDKSRKPEIFSYGHRNPQGLAQHPETGKIWLHEHGPRGGDEVNILKAGANYGWPAITYGIDYSGAIISDKTHAPGMEQPVIYWKPSIAPSGMAFYTGDKFPKWKGDIFVGALAKAHLRRLELQGDKVIEQEVLLKDLDERIRDVRSGPDGYLYVLTDSDDGMILRLKPAE